MSYIYTQILTYEIKLEFDGKGTFHFIRDSQKFLKRIKRLEKKWR